MPMAIPIISMPEAPRLAWDIERAMGIEFHPKFLSLTETRCH
jgi:hypothetical protein